MKIVSYAEARNSLQTVLDSVIDDAHRLVYAVDNDAITIITCRYHY